MLYIYSLPGGSNGKDSACNAQQDPGSITGSRRLPGEGNGSSLQYSLLENPNSRGAWPSTVHRVTKSWTRLNWSSTHSITEKLIKYKHRHFLLPLNPKTHTRAHTHTHTHIMPRRMKHSHDPISSKITT